jgi:hypothetical protein
MGPMALAGSGEGWEDRVAAGIYLQTLKVITGPLNELWGVIHSRMPAILGSPKGSKREPR